MIENRVSHGLWQLEEKSTIAKSSGDSFMNCCTVVQTFFCKHLYHRANCTRQCILGNLLGGET